MCFDFINLLCLSVPTGVVCEEQKLVPLKLHHIKQIADRVSLIQRTCSRYEITITNIVIIKEWFSISCTSFYGPIAFNRSLARAIHGLKPDEEPTSRRNVIDCLEESLKDVYEILEDVETAICKVAPSWQVDYQIVKLVKLFHRSDFANGLVECLSDDDIKCIKEFNHDQNKILCNQLGLKEEITNLVPDGEIRSHKSFVEWVMMILKDRYENVKGYSSNMAALQDLGFTQSAAAVLADWIDSTESMSHKDMLYWVCYHLKSLSDAIIMQVGNITEFPFNEDKVSERFNIQVTGSEEFSVSGVNVLYDKDFKNNQKVLLKKMLPEINIKEEVFWYHGTILKHEQNIRNNGVDLSCASAGDFSKNGCGFYVALDIDHAIDFAKAKVLGDRIFAVLVFKVGNDFYKPYTGRDLTSEAQLWREATHYYNNYQRNGNLREPKELRKLHYIRGPTSKYDGGRRRGSSFHQLCIRNDGMADLFYRELCSILYFKK